MTDPNPAGDSKTRLRKDARRKRSALSNDYRREASARITDAAVRLPQFRRAATIGCYLPMANEVDTWPLVSCAWRMKKRIFVPVVGRNSSMRFREVNEESDISVNALGIPEPQSGDEIPARDLDIVFVPVVAFDQDCNRIGAGGGYYDRAFAYQSGRHLYFRPKLIGLAFDCQRVEKIAPNPWDIRLFCVLTESQSGS